MADDKLSCVFIHGWGMNQAVWQPVLESLPDWIQPVCIDLPGHGLSAHTSFEHIDDLVKALDVVVDKPAFWVGWSLGGLALMQLALLKPEKIKAMMLVTSTPCFVEKQDWVCGMKQTTFDDFAADFEQDYDGTIKRFLSLQVKGSESGRRLLKTLRKKILQQPPANNQALVAGLNALKSVDLRSQMNILDMPVTWVFGQQDSLLKQTMHKEIEALLPTSTFHVIEKAAHAPFLSHTELFVQQLVSFADQI